MYIFIFWWCKLSCVCFPPLCGSLLIYRRNGEAILSEAQELTFDLTAFEDKVAFLHSAGYYCIPAALIKVSNVYVYIMYRVVSEESNWRTAFLTQRGRDGAADRGARGYQC